MHGLCECGCGEPTRISTRTDRSRGWIKGEPIRYIRGHSGSTRTTPRRPLEIDGDITRVPLISGGYAIVDTDDYQLVAPYRWTRHSQGYVVSRDGQKDGIGLLHHLIAGKPPKGALVDHRNGDKFDNRRNNLRHTDYKRNGLNRQTVDKRSLSGMPGVSAWKGRYSVFIYENGKRKFLGSRDTLLEAGELRKAAELRIYGEASPALLKAIRAARSRRKEVVLSV